MESKEIFFEEQKLSLEKQKLKQQKLSMFISILTPLAIVIAGAFIQKAVSEEERDWKSGERRAEQRVAVYSSIGPILNIIYCYAEEVGDYTRYSPEEIVSKKREVDRMFFTYHAYWSPETKGAYEDFMKAAFEPYQGVATDAKIRSPYFQKKVAFDKRRIDWKESWTDAFTGESAPLLREQYLKMVTLFLDDLQKNYGLKEAEKNSIGNG